MKWTKICKRNLEFSSNQFHKKAFFKTAEKFVKIIRSLTRFIYILLFCGFLCCNRKFSPGRHHFNPFPSLHLTCHASRFRNSKMPKDKKRSKRDSSSDSDSGPDDKGPAKKAAKSSSSNSCDALNDGSGEPSWSLGNMKFVKVWFSENFSFGFFNLLIILSFFSSGERIQGKNLHWYSWILHWQEYHGNETWKERNLLERGTILQVENLVGRCRFQAWLSQNCAKFAFYSIFRKGWQKNSDMRIPSSLKYMSINHAE